MTVDFPRVPQKKQWIKRRPVNTRTEEKKKEEVRTFLYNNIYRPSRLAAGADLHCFKNRIEPKWEDPVCVGGGKWTMTFPKSKSDTCGLYTLLAMIGEQFDHGDEICGAVVNVRSRQEKIALWTKNAANEPAQMSIGKQWKEFLDYNDMIGFIFHVCL
ncbi:putative translation Initiation factor eIF-4e, eukaryotic translation initiation factor 4E (eIF-4E) [Helianthus debilis subsp. tardiflorus]